MDLLVTEQMQLQLHFRCDVSITDIRHGGELVDAWAGGLAGRCHVNEVAAL
jgi:hypothetical protein